MKKVLDLIKEVFSEWSEDHASRLSAALAYYTIFSLAPLLVIVIAIAGMLGGRDAVQNMVMSQIGGLVGSSGQEFVLSMVTAAGQQKNTGMIAAVLSIITLLFGALSAFGELHNSLNTIWEVKPEPVKGTFNSIKRFFVQRFLSFTLVLGVGFLLLAALVVSAGLSAFNNFLGGLLPFPSFVLSFINFIVSLGVITLLFAMIFKILPDVEIAWKDVWLGALVTSVLFNLGKYAIGLYLGQSSVSSVFGAAGSLAILLIWIYYSAQILFLGAEFTQVYANRYGKKIVPDEDAVLMAEDDRVQQGMPHEQTVKEKAGQAVPAGSQPASGVPAASPVLSPLSASASSSAPEKRRPAAWEVLTRNQPHVITPRRPRSQSSWPFTERSTRKRDTGAIISVALLSGLVALATSVGQIVRDIRSPRQK